MTANHNVFNMINNNPLNDNFYVVNNFQNANNQNKAKYPHKTGLLNIGKSSYMNVSIQCLSNIELISNYFLNFIIYSLISIKIN